MFALFVPGVSGRRLWERARLGRSYPPLGRDNGSVSHAQGDEPKRHHYVPQTYLRGWADSTGQVGVRRRRGPSGFIASVKNVGVEAHLYGSGAAATWRESNFSLIEGAWPHLRRELTASGRLRERDRDQASLFMALQIARSREHIASSTFIAELAEYKPERPLTRAAVRTFIRARHGHVPGDREVEAAWTLAHFQIEQGLVPTLDQAFSASMDVAVRDLAPLLSSRHWRVERSLEPILWSSDRPVMPWRPPSDRDAFEGVGYADCDEIRMPIGPRAMLVLERRPSVTPIDVHSRVFHRYNDDIALQCYEFIVSVPGRRSRLDAAVLADHRPAVRFNIGPGFETGADGVERPMGDIVHSWTPLRSFTN